MSAVIKNDLNQYPLSDTPLCSGFGQYHTDNPTSKHPKPYNTITLNDIFNMVEKPQKVDKAAAQWVIFSDLITRESSKQSAAGNYYAVWFDFDEHTLQRTIKDVLAKLVCDYAIYSSRSATAAKQKWRVIVPLNKTATAKEWQQIAQIINDKFEAAGIVPDRASERISQICYLPNEGDFYVYVIERNREPLNWQVVLSAELVEKQQQANREQLRLDQLKEASRLKAVERVATGNLSPIDAYNAAYSLEQSLEVYGYKRIGKKYLSPNAQSGAAGVSVKGDKWLSMHGSDAGIGHPNREGGGCHGDAFDLFTYYEHGGNRNAAIKAAGAMFTTANGSTLNKANQRAFMEQNSTANSSSHSSFKPDRREPDYSTMPPDDYDHAPIGNDALNFEGDTVASSTLEPAPTTPAKLKELNDYEAALLNGVYSKAEQPPMGTVTPLVTKPKPKTDNSTFKTISLRDLLNRKYVTNWLVKGVIEQGNLALFFGDSASGKTFYIMDMCFCIAAGIDFKGKATKQGNVLYICGEGFSGLQKRFMALFQHYGVMPENLHLSEQPAAFMDISSAAAVMDTINQIGNVSLIVIDTFHRNMGGGSEDSAADISQFLGNIDTFLKPTGAAVAIIHHSGHGEKGRSRGSSSIKAAMDVEYQVVKDQLTNMVTVTNTKMKDWQAPPPACFNMNVVNLFDDHNQPISDEDGELLTSVILEPTDYTPTSKAKTNLKPNDEKVLSGLNKALNDSGIEPPQTIKDLFLNSDHNTPIQVVNVENWRAAAYESITVDIDESTKDKSQAKRKEFKRIREKLEKIGLIGLHGGYAWIVEY